MQHPLKNPSSRYYELYDSVEAIDVLEKIFTKDELLAWAKISLLSYQLRLGRKEGTVISEEKHKMETFKEYINYLKGTK